MIMRERQRKGAVGVREVGGGIIIRERQRMAKAGAGVPKFRKRKFRRNLTVPKISRKRTHSTQHYLNTLPKTYPILIHKGKDPSRLSGTVAYVKT